MGIREQQGEVAVHEPGFCLLVVRLSFFCLLLEVGAAEVGTDAASALGTEASSHGVQQAVSSVSGAVVDAPVVGCGAWVRHR